mgnify:FL=1
MQFVDKPRVLARGQTRMMDEELGAENEKVSLTDWIKE